MDSSTRFPYPLAAKCAHCGEEFQEHAAKAPHASLPFQPRCGGFALHRKMAMFRAMPSVAERSWEKEPKVDRAGFGLSPEGKLRQVIFNNKAFS